MANVQRIFPLTIFKGLVFLLLITNNAKTIAARYVSFTIPQTNDHPPQKPTCMKRECNKDMQNNLSPSLPHSFHQKASLSPTGSNSIQRYSLQPNNNIVDRVFRESFEGLYTRNRSTLQRGYTAKRLVPTGPNRMHNR